MTDRIGYENQLANEPVFEKFDVPVGSPVKPAQLTLGDAIQFRCHRDIECFNACCGNIDITLTPYDLVRASRRLGIKTWEFLRDYSMHYDLDPSGMPGIKMRPVEQGTACRFMTDAGCAIYEDRPTACRYYPMGTMAMRRKDQSVLEDLYFLVGEAHCLGHNEDRKLTVREFRDEQHVADYDNMNREWMDIIIKKRSSGPTVGSPSKRSYQLFALASYDLDSFREFVQADNFQAMFELADVYNQQLRDDDEELIRFGARFIKQVMFGEHTIPLRPGAREARYAARKDHMEAAYRKDVEKYRLKDPREGDE